MTERELYELKERLADAQYELIKVRDEIEDLSPEDKEVFDRIIIW